MGRVLVLVRRAGRVILAPMQSFAAGGAGNILTFWNRVTATRFCS